ncbi:crossover junction endonuclease MUS81 [Fragilaria crotonensis]|nr:crossover junction endonuclease MUS81 [Fragilaria crotonensis]
MPRAKDTKVWNEDLTLAFAARAQQALAEGKSSTIGWNKAAEIIQAVRKDIYKAKTGRIYNLPENKLGKNALALAHDIMSGNKSIIPDGHIPQNEEQANLAGQKGSWDNYPYLKKIKMRGGAYAILMAFHHSSTKTLSKPQICQLAQPYCDEDMDADFHAGRMHGAWAANKTLLKHHLLTTEGNNRQYIHGVGFRSNGCASFTLTSDGEQFTEAMLRKFGGRTQRGATGRSSSTMTKAAVFSTQDLFTGTPQLVTAQPPSRRTTMKEEFVSPVKRPFAGTGYKLDAASPGKRIRPAEAAAAAALARAACQDSKRSSNVVPRSLFTPTPTSESSRTFISEKASPAGRRLFNNSVTIMRKTVTMRFRLLHFCKEAAPGNLGDAWVGT